MFRTIVYAFALSAIALSPTIAAAKSGGGMGKSMGNSGPAMRQQTTSNKPNFEFKKTKILHCGKYGRGDGHGGVTMVTVCN